jgi:hypothetical protein
MAMLMAVKANDSLIPYAKTDPVAVARNNNASHKTFTVLLFPSDIIIGVKGISIGRNGIPL